MKHAKSSLVRTNCALPDYGLEVGALGTVLDVYEDGAGYDVEFPEANNLSHVVTVRGDQLEPAQTVERRGTLTTATH